SCSRVIPGDGLGSRSGLTNTGILHGPLYSSAFHRNCQTGALQSPGLPAADMGSTESAACVVVAWISAGVVYMVRRRQADPTCTQVSPVPEGNHFLLETSP